MSELDWLSLLSVFIGLENLEENRQQSAQQEKILQELNAKFDMLMDEVKRIESNRDTL